VSSQDGSDICRKTGGSLFQRYKNNHGHCRPYGYNLYRRYYYLHYSIILFVSLVSKSCNVPWRLWIFLCVGLH